jgi:putative flippase GtrA
MGRMQPTAAGASSRFERHLEKLGDRRALGVAVRFFLRRREQVLYLVAGAWNTVFGFGVWAGLQVLLGDRVHYLVVVVIAWPIAVLNAYLCYRYLVFRSRGPILRELPRFSLVYVVTLVATLAVLPVALNVLPFNIYVVQGLLTTVVIICSYLSHRYYSFGGEQRRAVAAFHDTPAVAED